MGPIKVLTLIFCQYDSPGITGRQSRYFTSLSIMKSITVITIGVIVVLGSALAVNGYGGGYSGGFYPSYGGGYSGGYGFGGSGGFGLIMLLILILVLFPLLFNQGSTDTIKVVNVGSG
ncbi:hypothetical protein CHS0354_034908 [Potamilus streckersoni]|uniref:Uncharacterized protein n=1 Tax=Potamilus streckersoni TaxID=2493646 RepID=A0AAE0SDG7_9BIVA|nr:hypothetical protein CHS0354_034908 [Potamilus streckersoni]